MPDSGEKTVTPEGRFVAFLQGLERRQDRGSLAKLRRSVGKDTPSAEAMRLIAPFLPSERSRTWRVRCYELIAGLFALNPAQGGQGNLGHTFRRLGDHESAQKRFVALLDSDADDLPHRLRQAVSLAKSKDVPIHWAQLLSDLFHWEHEDRYVQYKWARAYWGEGIATQEPTALATSGKEGA